MNTQETIRVLEEQIETLKKEKRTILEAIELAANLGNFRISLNKIDDPLLIIRETTARVSHLLDLKAVSYYLVDENDSNFYQEYTDPPDYATPVDNEINYLIEDKTFFWALTRNKPVVVSSRDKQDQIILHSMNTSSRSRGLFVGVLGSPAQEISDLSLFLFSITIIACSSALESFELYRQIRGKNKQLNDTILQLEQSGKELQASEEKYRALFEQAANSIILYDLNTHRPVEFNDTAHKNLGYTREEFKNIPVEAYEVGKTTEDIRAHFQLLCSTKQSTFETQHKRKNGETRNIIVNNQCIDIDGQNFILSYLTDITEQKRNEQKRIHLEQQLRQSQKMESIGTLAGGIAHDFNNILAIILGYAELSILDIPKSMEQLRYNLSQLIMAVSRAQKLVGQILTFSRKGEDSLSPIIVNTIIKETMEMLRSTLPSNIEIRHDIADEPLIIMGSSVHVHQVIMNLCSNSAKAMEGKKGTLSVQVKKLEINDENVNIADNKLLKGEYVQIIIKDTGCGIAPQYMERIFDPYFTTKEPGQGTGLGLAIVHGIVSSYNGYISVRSQIEAGTSFDILIPLLSSSSDNC